jgi:hypothetical protein
MLRDIMKHKQRENKETERKRDMYVDRETDREIWKQRYEETKC